MILTRRSLIAGLAAATLPRAATAKDRPMPEPAIVELRQYTLFGGRRDALIDLFERAFIEPQNALGAHVLGSFTDLDDPDRFVWLRGFVDMAVRGTALPAFYTGPVWQAHRNAANATMRDSDNVLLLRLLTGSLAPRAPAPFVSIDIHTLHGIAPTRFAAFFETAIRPRLTAAGIDTRATLATEAAPNNFAPLPVRDESVFVHIAAHASLADMAKAERALADTPGWRDTAPDDLLPSLMRKPERLRLRATTRSALR